MAPHALGQAWFGTVGVPQASCTRALLRQAVDANQFVPDLPSTGPPLVHNITDGPGGTEGPEERMAPEKGMATRETLAGY